jgi:hypothetical protein
MYRVKDTEPCVIFARTSYHGMWNSHLVTQRQKVSELTLVPREPLPKLKPSNLRDVLNLVRYLRNPQNATFFEALASDSINEVAEGNAEPESEDYSSGLDE